MRDLDTYTVVSFLAKGAVVLLIAVFVIGLTALCWRETHDILVVATITSLIGAVIISIGFMMWDMS